MKCDNCDRRVGVKSARVIGSLDDERVMLCAICRQDKRFATVHGGARKGAGRHPIPNPLVKITARVSQEHLAYLHSLDPNLSKAIRTLIQTAHH